MANSNALIDDRKAQSAQQFNLVDSLKKAASLRDSKPLSVVADWWRLKKKGGALSFEEYFQYRLYDPSFTKEFKEDFISEKLHWEITNKASDLSWRAATEDKWLSYEILQKLGFPTPVTIAVSDASIRNYGPCRKISNEDEFSEFLNSVTKFPIFAKPNHEFGSFGAFLIEGVSDNRVMLGGDEPKSISDVYNSMIAKTDYIFQEFIQNHSAIAKYSKYLATVRTVNMINEDRVMTPFTLLKIPTSTNIADNYWRKGNLLANIDTKTGEILRVVSGTGLSMEEHETHPETGDKLVGETLPCWDELRDLNDACARSFSPVRYQSLDIAITEEGPVIVEINSGGSFFLPQLASGNGLMTKETRAFFESCGWKPK